MSKWLLQHKPKYMISSQDLRRELEFDSIEEFIDIEGQNTAQCMPLHDDDICWEIDQIPTEDNERLTRWKNWREVAKFIRQEYVFDEVPDYIYIHVWW